jgi:ATP-dependent exoDNAse (exonuclease V) beta subunit
VLPNATLSIFNASAGTGKTFTLTKEYLALCLCDENKFRYREILALTFTNRASAEMRTRIIQSLKHIAEGQKSPISELLATELRTDSNTLAQRAYKVLSAIIHDLSSVSISTIDKFTYRLLRSFSFELGINTNARLRMDTAMIARQTVDNLMNTAAEREEEQLRKYLQEFVRDQMRNDYSWNILGRLEDIVRNLHHENDLEAVNVLKNYSLEELSTARKALNKQIKELREKINNSCLPFIHAFKSKTTPDSAISYVNDYYNFCNKAKHTPTLPGKRIISNRENSFLKKGSEDIYGADMEPATQAFDRMMSTLPGDIATYNLLDEIKKSFDSIALIGVLQKAYENIRENENFVNIGEFQPLIHELTGSDEPDFIFERLGDKYKYFFIDEFQDTSTLQWKNLKTLALHAMANNGSTMLVGDPKQSIYRWRGSNPEMFIDLIDDKDPDRFSVLTDGRIVPRYDFKKNHLPVNYRSGKSIVRFVHDLFHRPQHEGANTAADIAYREINRESSKDYEGYVQIELIGKKAFEDKEAADEHLEKRCIELISQTLNGGFDLSDIAILVRKNEEGQRVAEWIEKARQNNTDKQLRVISHESFILDEQPSIRLVIAAMAHLLYPGVKTHRYNMLQELYQLGKLPWNSNEIHLRLKELIAANTDDYAGYLQIHFPEYKPRSLHSLPVTEKCIRLMQMFDMRYGEDVFLQSFIEQVRSVTNENPMDELEFLNWWDDPGRDSMSIEIPDKLNAINIISIHKSKGLEWPVVIMPFVNWTYDNRNDYLWYRKRENEHIPLEHVRVKPKNHKDDQPFPETYNTEVSSLREAQEFDNLNLLYVSFTRAAQRLHVITQAPTRKENNTCSFLARRLFPDFNDDEVNVFETGEKAPKVHDGKVRSDSEERHIQHISTGSAAPTLRVGRKHSPGINEIAAIARGNLIHEVLQRIELNPEKRGEIMQQMLREKRIARESCDDIALAVENVLQQDICKKIFAEHEELLSEQTILLPGGEVLRPDLVALMPNRSVIIIDYKSGDPRNEHRTQIDAYIKAFKEMGYAKVEGELVYIRY